MGKTKTAILTNEPVAQKTSAELYAEKKAKKAAMMVKSQPKSDPKINSGMVEEGKSPSEVPADLTGPREMTKSTSLGKVVEKIRGKKYLESKAKISKATLYKLEDAIKIVKENSYSIFDGTMELHIIVKKTGQAAQVTLPFSTGKQKRVEIADEKTLTKLKTGKIDFDLLLSTAEMMPKLAMFAKILGPRGLMPNPKNGTVIKNKSEAERFLGNHLQLKTEKDAPLIHTNFGKVSQKTEELVTNAEIIISAIGGSKTIIRAFMKSTMSPSVKVAI